MRSFRSAALLGAATVLGVIATVVIAGPLNPPAGPVSSTYKTLTEIEPRIAINAANTRGDENSLYRITQPGSYYLTGNIVGVTGKHGIEVVASNVSIDLMGFELRGVAGSLNGIHIDGSNANMSVRNGSIVGWQGDGLNAQAGAGTRLEAIACDDNLGRGIHAGGGAILKNCAANRNGLVGIESSGLSVIEGCVAHINGRSGFVTGTAEVIRHCSAAGNAGSGFEIDNSTTQEHCTAVSNTAGGVTAGPNNIIRQSSFTNNSLHGVTVDAGSLVEACAVSNNAGRGIIAASSRVEGCIASSNLFEGIRTASFCTVLRNQCNDNGSVGIRIIGTDSRVADNTCLGNAVGIDLDLAGNIAMRNVCAGNDTNWDVVNGNVCLVVQAMTTTGFTGNAGGAAPGSTDPNANFSY